jgi:hypothetical protein
MELIMKKIIILAAMVLSGCDADGNLGSEGSGFWHDRTTIAEKVKYFKPTCIAYGFKEGSAELNQCVADEIRASKAAADAKMAASLARASASSSTSYSKSSLICRNYGTYTRCS